VDDADDADDAEDAEEALSPAMEYMLLEDIEESMDEEPVLDMDEEVMLEEELGKVEVLPLLAFTWRAMWRTLWLGVLV